MTDKEFLELKNTIIEVGIICKGLNTGFQELQKEMLELDKSITALENDVNNLKGDLK